MFSMLGNVIRRAPRLLLECDYVVSKNWPAGNFNITFNINEICKAPTRGQARSNNVIAKPGRTIPACRESQQEQTYQVTHLWSLSHL